MEQNTFHDIDESPNDQVQVGLMNGETDHGIPTPFQRSAIQQTKSTGLNKWSCITRTAALCGAYFSLGLCMAVTGPTLPYLQRQVGVSIQGVSYMFTSRSVGVLCGSIFGGAVLDYCNPYSLLFVVITAMAIGIGAMPWCHQLWLLMISSSLIGISGGFLDTGASVLCLELWGTKSGPYMQAMHFTFALGGSVAPLLVQAFLGDVKTTTSDLSYSSRHPCSVDYFSNTTSSNELMLNIQILEKEPSLIDTMNHGNSTVVPALTVKPKPKPTHTDGAILGDSSQFEKIPLVNEKPGDSQPNDPLLSQTTTTKKFLASSNTYTDLHFNSSRVQDLLVTSPAPLTTLTIFTTTNDKFSTITDVPATSNLPTKPTTTTATSPSSTKTAPSTKDTDDADIATNVPFEKYGVTQLHMLYTSIALIVLHVALTFLFFLCSATQRSAIAAQVAEQHRKRDWSLRPLSRIFFVGLLFIFYLVYVGTEVSYGQFLTTFALESRLRLSSSLANYVTLDFWVSFAICRFLSIFVAHFIKPTKMLIVNVVLCCSSSLVLAIAGQSSIILLYVGSALLGVGLASMFATGFLFAEQWLSVTNRIASLFSIASALGELIFPAVTGALMEKNLMSLMYVVLTTNFIGALTFCAAWYLTMHRTHVTSLGGDYQLAPQVLDN